MEVRVWSYLEQLSNEKKDINHAIQSVLDSGVLILGENVKKFEDEFSSYCNSKYGVGVNSATDALFLALKAMKIEKGDEIITVSNTAVPTVSAIVAAGGIPVFVDIHEESYLMDINEVEKSINNRTKGIVAVHLYGQCVDMDRLNSLAKKNKIFVIEDCSQSHGAIYKNKIAGSMSDISAFSFYPTKLLGGYGDGGMMVCNSVELYNKMKRLRFYGMEKTYYANEDGYNSRLDEIHAAILRTKLKNLNNYIDKRRAIAKIYQENLSNTNLVLPKELSYNRHAYYVYVVRHENRDVIMKKLKGKNIFLNISYPWPIHIMDAYKDLGYKKGAFPITEKCASEIFSLPMYPELSFEKQQYVITELKKII